jgi:hypothetical protein
MIYVVFYHVVLFSRVEQMRVGAESGINIFGLGQLPTSKKNTNFLGWLLKKKKRKKKKTRKRRLPATYIYTRDRGVVQMGISRSAMRVKNSIFLKKNSTFFFNFF